VSPLLVTLSIGARRGFLTSRTRQGSTRPITTRSGRVEPRTRATNGTDMPSAGARRPLEAIRSPAAVREPGRLISCPQRGPYEYLLPGRARDPASRRLARNPPHPRRAGRRATHRPALLQGQERGLG